MKQDLLKHSVKDVKRLRPYERSTRRELEDIYLRGKGLPETDVKKLAGQYTDAMNAIKPEFDQQAAEQAKQFGRYVEPQTQTQYGSAGGQGSRSSALNQALSAGRVDLASRLSSQYENLRQQIAQNLMNQSQQSQVTGLNARLQAMSPFTGGNMNNVAANYSMQPTPASTLSTTVGSLLPIAGTIAGGMAGGPPGAMAGGTAGRYAQAQL